MLETYKLSAKLFFSAHGDSELLFWVIDHRLYGWHSTYQGSPTCRWSNPKTFVPPSTPLIPRLQTRSSRSSTTSTCAGSARNLCATHAPSAARWSVVVYSS